MTDYVQIPLLLCLISASAYVMLHIWRQQDPVLSDQYLESEKANGFPEYPSNSSTEPDARLQRQETGTSLVYDLGKISSPWVSTEIIHGSNTSVPQERHGSVDLQMADSVFPSTTVFVNRYNDLTDLRTKWEEQESSATAIEQEADLSEEDLAALRLLSASLKALLNKEPALRKEPADQLTFDESDGDSEKEDLFEATPSPETDMEIEGSSRKTNILVWAIIVTLLLAFVIVVLAINFVFGRCANGSRHVRFTRFNDQ